MEKNFKDVMQGTYFAYELFNNQFIQCIKKTSKTALVLIDDKKNFIMYFGKNEKVKELNRVYIPYID
tara:strand:- start:273 stop:473 length:201 start_codon:yes stop_codon:yes gene_type:complete